LVKADLRSRPNREFDVEWLHSSWKRSGSGDGLGAHLELRSLQKAKSPLGEEWLYLQMLAKWLQGRNIYYIQKHAKSALQETALNRQARYEGIRGRKRYALMTMRPGVPSWSIFQILLGLEQLHQPVEPCLPSKYLRYRLVKHTFIWGKSVSTVAKTQELTSLQEGNFYSHVEALLFNQEKTDRQRRVEKNCIGEASGSIEIIGCHGSP
jgi:hypothetical protein